MKFTTVATVAAMAVVASAQNIPSCALSCVSSTPGCNGLSDLQCMCTKTAFQAALKECLCKSCGSPADQQAAASTAQTMCKSINPSLSIDTNCGAAAAPAASSKPAAPPAASSKPAAPASSAPAGPVYGGSSSAPAPTYGAPTSVATSAAPAKSSPCPSASGNGTAPNPTGPAIPIATGAASKVVPGVLALAGAIVALAL